MLKPIGYYISVEPIYHIIGIDKLIGLVVGAGESVDKDRVKIGDHIMYNPNYANHISYKNKPFDILHQDFRFKFIEDIGKLLNDNICGGKDIVNLKEE